jgi:hypothetical protein
MCIAQKTLKNMPSTTPDMNQDDDLDDSNFTPKSGAASPVLSPLIHDRSTLINTTMDETYHFDQPSPITPIINSSEPSSSLFFDFDHRN